MKECVIPFTPIYEDNSCNIAKITETSTKQLLSLLACMFIKHKTVFYNAANYDYFIVYDSEIKGYFSRDNSGNYSLCCVLVWPCFARQGLGSLLIDFSYKISNIKSDIDIPGPERPFSKKAILCFRKYWKYRVIGAKTIRQISEEANISIDDAIVGLELNGFNFKKWTLDGEISVSKPRLLSKNMTLK